MSLILSGSDGLSDIDGSAATPAIRGTDANTGIFFPAADTIAFSEAGVEAMRLDSSGDVNLYNAKSFKVYNSTNTRFGSLFTDGNGTNLASHNGSGEPLLFNSPTGYIALSTNGSERARIDSSGRLLVGATSVVNAETGLGVVNSTSANPVVAFRNSRNTNGDVCLNLLVGSNCQNTSSYLLQGAVFGVANVIYIFGNGNVQNTNNSYGAISDSKLKENIVDATPKLADLMQVKVRNYNLIGSTTKQIGVVAQELETIFPAMIDESPDRDSENNILETTTKSVKYSVFVPMLIKAIQEQQALITQLQADVAALKA